MGALFPLSFLFGELHERFDVIGHVDNHDSRHKMQADCERDGGMTVQQFGEPTLRLELGNDNHHGAARVLRLKALDIFDYGIHQRAIF